MRRQTASEAGETFFSIRSDGGTLQAAIYLEMRNLLDPFKANQSRFFVHNVQPVDFRKCFLYSALDGIMGHDNDGTHTVFARLRLFH